MRITINDINHVPDFDCYKVIGAEAHFQNEGKRYRYTFNSIEEAEKWKQERSAENRKAGFIEDFQAADEKGFFQYSKYYKLQKMMGIPFTPPNCLAAIRGLDEITENETDLEFVEDRISNEPWPLRRIEKDKKVIGKNRKEKLKMLTDRFNLPEYMGELFLSEINLSDDEGCKQAARLLGLLEW